MHEMAMVGSIIAVVKAEMERQGNVKMVKEVHLEIGELTFLGHDQMRFGFENMTASDPRINSEGLTITSIPAVIKCKECDYEGGLDITDDEQYHTALPIFACPKCNGPIDIIEGKECIVKNLVIDMEED